MPYSDPEAEENADEAAIGSGLKGIQDVYARRGKDWKIERRKNARALGMTEDEYLEALRKKYFTVKQGGARIKPPQIHPRQNRRKAKSRRHPRQNRRARPRAPRKWRPRPPRSGPSTFRAWPVA